MEASGQMQRGTITPKKIIKSVLALLLLLPAGFVLWIWAALAWIQFRPLPPIPHYEIGYSVADAGEVGDRYLDFYSPDSLSFGARLTAAGKLVQLDEAAQAQDEARRKDLIATAVQKLGFTEKNDGDLIGATANDGLVLLRTDASWLLFRNGKPLTKIPEGVQGYSWKPRPLIFRFSVMNAQDEAIGNGRIATGYASSGGLSSPHGRWLPLVWHGDSRRPEDLNSLIDAQSGWYLDRAIDLNESGWILCIGRRTDARGAEDYHMDNTHWVILTPKR